MLNIIQADLFKIRKGKAFFGVMLGFFITFVLVAIVFKGASSLTISGTEYYSDTGEKLEVEEVQEMQPANGGEFLPRMFRGMAGSYAFFILPFIITVFGADYASGTYRNLLSYHSGRSGIFAAKLITTVIITVAMQVGAGILAAIVGSIAFGFGGFSVAVIAEVLKAIVFMFPILLAFIAFGYCITALTKKTSYTIAIYFTTLIVWGIALSLVAAMIPKMKWITELDLLGALTTAVQYAAGADVSLAVPMVFSIALLIGCGGLGLIRYQITDFDFN